MRAAAHPLEGLVAQPPDLEASGVAQERFVVLSSSQVPARVPVVGVSGAAGGAGERDMNVLRRLGLAAALAALAMTMTAGWVAADKPTRGCSDDFGLWSISTSART